ncbi:GNAT family N-acetyltransferase [Olivibacter ginsenosidimutans]|uniref:GNAT family N-acetyltransferase n=1 Tax=Olivibacter ginsenosidimutans TaxID=1176537 RepID=A0ABP9C789_9SPHI
MNIVEVSSKSQLKTFIDFPHELYKDDPNYVPELFVAQRDILTPGKHPFYKHSYIQLFLAYRDNQVVGRIAAIYNTNHNAFTGANDGFFGFFDTINDQEVVDALLDQSIVWLKTKGATKIVGPVNLSTNETCGLLVKGFDRPPVAMMPYNKPYYESLLLHTGLKKQTDLLAYLVRRNNLNDRSVRLLEALENRLLRSNIRIRQIDKKNLKNEIPKIKALYNSAWDKNLGFVPMTDDEFNYMAKDLALLLDPKYAIIAEQGDKMVGFALGIPDINQILIKIKRGRLFPTGIFKLLFGLKNVTGVRVLLLGVIDGYRKLGIEACLYGRLIKNAEGTKLEYAECSWMLEDNYLMNHAIEQINGELYKRYRLFEKPI